jgi:hypothetical protein
MVIVAYLMRNPGFLAGGSHEDHETLQSEPKFEPGTSKIWKRSVNRYTAPFCERKWSWDISFYCL